MVQLPNPLSASVTLTVRVVVEVTKVLEPLVDMGVPMVFVMAGATVSVMKFSRPSMAGETVPM